MVLAVAALLSLVGTALSGELPAVADTGSIQPIPPATVTADRLPTVQIDGVVWSQVVVGKTVYAGGRFDNARPAGAAAGTNLTARGNLLAYDIATGALVTSFAPTLNGQVLSVAASPDGTRLYVVGDFTTANGAARRRVAAYSTATGALITSFNPVGVNSQARAVVATNDTVYVGGGFLGAGGTTRNNLAAFRASDGGLLPWNPNADYTVWALALSADNSTVFAGGSFQNVGGSGEYGMAKISAAGAGAVDTAWQANSTVRNAGVNAGITSLRVHGGYVYGTAYHFGAGGNLEGVFKASTSTGVVDWVTDCHGDNYSVFVSHGIVYSVGHAHYCGNMGGGFPQYSQSKYQHSQAWTDTAGGDILNEVHGYPNWHNVKPGPSIVNWLPTMTIGQFTGQFQAGWSITGTDDYVVVGGEFPSVNGTGQQGLVRFARRPIAAGAQGPRFAGGSFAPTLVPTSTTSVRVTWPAAYDRDDLNLTYRLFRGTTNVFTKTAASNWWTVPALGYGDTGLTAGGTYTYRLTVSDPGGNVVNGSSATITLPASVPAKNAYTQTVLNAGARIYWPLNETAGLKVTDRARTVDAVTGGVTDGRGDSGVTWNQTGAIAGTTAASMGDNDSSRVYATSTEMSTNAFTLQTWIRTTTTRGGRILGFGDLATGNSGHRDRHLYMTDNGRLVFGVKAPDNSLRTLTSTASYNNNTWYLVTATMGPSGMTLYVNGTAVATRVDTTQGERYLGQWRLGGDNLARWPSRPSTNNFIGTVDEVAVYPTALSASTVASIYAARNGGAVNQPPVAAFTSTQSGRSTAVDGSGSSDPDGTITGYSWSFGDGGTATGANASHTYATAGTYTVALKVTDNGGATSTVSHSVTVTAPLGGVAADAFGRTVTGGWGSADTGGPWTLSGGTTNFSVGGGVGVMQMATSVGPGAYLNGVSAADVDLRVQVAYDKAGSGGGVYSSLIGRRIGTSDYRVKVRVTATATTISLVRAVSGVETVLATQDLTGTYIAGEVINLRLQLVGSGTTTVRAKAWKSGGEPAAWLVSGTDSTAALQAPGAVGLYSYLSGSATNAPVRASFDSFSVQPAA